MSPDWDADRFSEAHNAQLEFQIDCRRRRGRCGRPPFFQRSRRPHNGMAVACTRAFNPPSGEGLSVFTQASVREAALAGTVTWT